MSAPRRSVAPRSADDAGNATELAAIMIAVFALFVLLLTMSVRWVTASAAEAASQRALEIAQAPGGTPPAVDAAATRLATSVLLVDHADVTISQRADQVAVTVTAHGRIGGAVSRTATGPMIRFIPQTRSGR
ncbi:hypothetical protein ND748_01040 [Frankia sp. AiPs1]|uniref:hypothetical protein n=1 Tax=Frankia sp. AiPs1 TaxID=573493 RepID=UPI0020449BAC|nr:hypothetical protein [Frankia sp. AiPs1]MCM3920274.1 hypothetical protein [Frankia sp. AiPs1]